MKKINDFLNFLYPPLTILVLSIILFVGYITTIISYSVPRIVKAISPDWYLPSQKQGTFEFSEITPIPTQATVNPPPPGVSPPPPVDNPPPASKQYCVDEDPGGVLIESCDDATRCDVAHGAGGPSGTCGTVIGWEHAIIESMLLSRSSNYNNTLLDNLPSAIQSSCYTATPYSPYISTFNVIDSYNLSGFHEFSRHLHADAAALETSWKTNQNYTVSTTANRLTPGDIVLFSNPPHVAIVNTVEIDDRGNGDIWFLHTGAAYYLGKLMVANWGVVASSTGDNNITFGSHQSKGSDTTIGETVCYCGSGNICYQWTFK